MADRMTDVVWLDRELFGRVFGWCFSAFVATGVLFLMVQQGLLEVTVFNVVVLYVIFASAIVAVMAVLSLFGSVIMIAMSAFRGRDGKRKDSPNPS